MRLAADQTLRAIPVGASRVGHKIHKIQASTKDDRFWRFNFIGSIIQGIALVLNSRESHQENHHETGENHLR